MGRPKNTNVRMGLSEDQKTIVIQVDCSTPQLAVKLYEKLESLLMEALREDLENDWQDDNPDS